MLSQPITSPIALALGAIAASAAGAARADDPRSLAAHVPPATEEAFSGPEGAACVFEEDFEGIPLGGIDGVMGWDATSTAFVDPSGAQVGASPEPGFGDRSLAINWADTDNGGTALSPDFGGLGVGRFGRLGVDVIAYSAAATGAAKQAEAARTRMIEAHERQFSDDPADSWRAKSDMAQLLLESGDEADAARALALLREAERESPGPRFRILALQAHALRELNATADSDAAWRRAEHAAIEERVSPNMIEAAKSAAKLLPAKISNRFLETLNYEAGPADRARPDSARTCAPRADSWNL